MRARRGFTLVEVLIAAILAAIVIGMLLIPIGNSIGYFRTATARGDAQNVARNALDTMAGELSEAAYVWQDMDDNTLLGFVPPLRVDPSDPNSQIVTPPRPDWDHAVRYWRALHNPQYNYSMGTTLAQPNPYYLARTVVPDSFYEEDAWNTGDFPKHNRNRAWAEARNTLGSSQDEAGVNWSPLTRMVSTDVDRKRGGVFGYRDKTLQPGYPYLEAMWNYTGNEQARFYRDNAVGLTPNATDYDVPQLQFEPMIVSGEWLMPGPDNSTYLAHYPLWRKGVSYTSWTALQGDNPVFPDTSVLDDWNAWGWSDVERRQGLKWICDPFLLIYRFHGTGGGGANPPPRQRLKRRRRGGGGGGGTGPQGEYELIGIGCFDWRSRTMKVIDPYTFKPVVDSNTLTGGPIYDTYEYPGRSLDPTQAVDIAFDVDWLNGTVRSDFPPYHAELRPARTADYPITVEGKEFRAVPHSDCLDYPLPLANLVWWETRAGATLLEHFLLPESVSVRVDSNGDGHPDRALQRVFRTPRDYSDEYQVGLDPAVADGDAGYPKYGFIRLPTHLSLWGTTRKDDLVTRVWSATKQVPKFWIYYRWRNNGVLVGGDYYEMKYEKPDLVSAYYRTASVIDINLTVTRTGARAAQSVHMTRRVKLQNVIREIRDVR